MLPGLYIGTVSDINVILAGLSEQSFSWLYCLIIVLLMCFFGHNTIKMQFEFLGTACKHIQHAKHKQINITFV